MAHVFSTTIRRCHRTRSKQHGKVLVSQKMPGRRRKCNIWIFRRESRRNTYRGQKGGGRLWLRVPPHSGVCSNAIPYDDRATTNTTSANKGEEDFAEGCLISCLEISKVGRSPDKLNLDVILFPSLQDRASHRLDMETKAISIVELPLRRRMCVHLTTGYGDSDHGSGY